MTGDLLNTLNSLSKLFMPNANGTQPYGWKGGTMRKIHLVLSSKGLILLAPQTQLPVHLRARPTYSFSGFLYFFASVPLHNNRSFFSNRCHMPHH